MSATQCVTYPSFTGMSFFCIRQKVQRLPNIRDRGVENNHLEIRPVLLQFGVVHVNFEELEYTNTNICTLSVRWRQFGLWVKITEEIWLLLHTTLLSFQTWLSNSAKKGEVVPIFKCWSISWKCLVRLILCTVGWAACCSMAQGCSYDPIWRQNTRKKSYNSKLRGEGWQRNEEKKFFLWIPNV